MPLALTLKIVFCANSDIVSHDFTPHSEYSFKQHYLHGHCNKDTVKELMNTNTCTFSHSTLY